MIKELLPCVVLFTGLGCETAVEADSKETAAVVAPEAREPTVWYEGGTLHKNTNVEWLAADERYRLATAADFAATIAKHRGVSSSSLDELLVRATALSVCITKASDVETEVEVSSLAASCAILLASND